MKKLGVIGGLGPMATAYLMELIINMTDASTDQEHIDMTILSRPSVPDRTAFILGKSSESPLDALLNMKMTLETLGVDIIALPCITAHYFGNKLDNEGTVPVIDGIDETISELKKAGVTKCGIMATDGTIESQLFQKRLEDAGIQYAVPSKVMQAKVMSLIYDNVKSGHEINMNDFNGVSDELRENGAEVIILGCTELSIIKRDKEIGAGYIDVIDAIARKAVLACGKLKEEYTDIITK